jgi:hypothetical protein
VGDDRDLFVPLRRQMEPDGSHRASWRTTYRVHGVLERCVAHQNHKGGGLDRCEVER